MISNSQSESEETNFVEFRRKVRSAEVLSSAMERLLWSLHFTGRVSVVVQNGRAERRAVTVGSVGSDEALISAGLTAGERVIAEPGSLADGAAVKEIKP